MTAPCSAPVPLAHSSDYRRGAIRGLSERYAEQVERSADVIAEAWLVARVGAELTGSKEAAAIAEALTPIVELLNAAQILDPHALTLPRVLTDFFAQMGLRAPSEVSLPRPEPRTFAQGFAVGRKYERVTQGKRRRGIYR